MRHFKTLMLAAVAVCALVAFAGAGTASATVVCATNSTPCNSILGSGTTITGHLQSGTTAHLTTSGAFINPTIDCSLSDPMVTTTSGGGSGLGVSGMLDSVNFDSCVSNAGCSSSGTVTGTPTSGSLSWISATMNGTLTVGAPSVQFTCSGIACTFGGGAGTVTGTLTGGSPATLTFTNQALHISAGGGCPTTANWTATYVTTSNLWVADA